MNPRAADLPVRIGLLPSGPTASVVDVPGVGVGHATVWRDEEPPPAQRRARQRLRGGRRVGERAPHRVGVGGHGDVGAARRGGADFSVRWHEATVRARADVTLVAGSTTYDLDISLQTWRDGEPFAARHWHRRVPRDLG